MEQAKKIPLVVVCGPTASGKTDLAVDLALQLSGEIISADSMQIYKGLDVGTAKPSIEERRGIVHHMLDIVEPDVHFSVADYCSAAAACVKEVYDRGTFPYWRGYGALYRHLLEGTRFESGQRDIDYRKAFQTWHKGKAKIVFTTF